MIHDQVPYERLPDRYTEADLLVLPMDFDKKSLTYMKYSMPTKVPEYLVSGVPILVLASEITALYKYAKSDKWAFLNAEENAVKIENQLLEIRNNYNLRVKISERAQSVGKQNHNLHRVRESFNELLRESSLKVI
jgi:glycosyltransferase involved in cell wall biosynthesis